MKPSTKLYFGRGILHESMQEVQGPYILLADLAVKERALEIAEDPIFFPGGEKMKTREAQIRLEKELFERDCSREVTLLIMGGGTLCDLGGFVASIYLRGISHIFIPTTLLCMIDACIGGKTAINTEFGKNRIGTFYEPKAIIADLDLLETLPQQEWLNGKAEILKLGIIYDADLLQTLSPERAMKKKFEIVEKDFQEQGLRHILNYGHTIAHGLESISEYQMPHGMAVALGCVVEAHLSLQLGYLSLKDFQKIESLFKSYPLKLPNQYERDLFLEALQSDKKKKNQELRFVLPEKIGTAVSFGGQYCRIVRKEELTPTLDWMETTYQPATYSSFSN